MPDFLPVSSSCHTMSSMILVAFGHHRVQESQLFNLLFYRKEMDSLGESGQGPVGNPGLFFGSLPLLALWFFLTSLLAGGTGRVYSGYNQEASSTVTCRGWGVSWGSMLGVAWDQKRNVPAKVGCGAPCLPLIFPNFLSSHEGLSVCLLFPRKGQLECPGCGDSHLLKARVISFPPKPNTMYVS